MPTDGDRVRAAVLCTDMVDSTSHLRRLGDSAWREPRSTTGRRAGSLTGFAGVRSRLPAMAFLPYSTDLLAQFDARRQSVRQSVTSASPSEPEFTQARSN